MTGGVVMLVDLVRVKLTLTALDKLVAAHPELEGELLKGELEHDALEGARENSGDSDRDA